MARGRLVSRTLGSSRKFAALRKEAGKLGEFAQALYPMLISNSDDFGRMSGDAFTVKHAVFPTSRRREKDFQAAIRSMASVGLILCYEANDVQVIQIVDFEEHQPGLSKRTRSKFPESPVNFTEIPSEEKGIEPKGIEPKGTALRARFERFWSVYPRKTGKEAAWGEWQRIGPDDGLTDQMVTAVTAQRGSAQWRKENGQFIPHPRTWLHQGRWQDEPDSGQQSRRNIDWSEECREQHGGTCTKRWDHEMRMKDKVSA